MNSVIENRKQLPPASIIREEIHDSFYHLAGVPLADSTPCHGTACFVARHLDRKRWQAACDRRPHVYCLGNCFTAPASPGENLQPHINVRSREAIVLKRLANGGAPTLAAYRERGGYLGFQAALRRDPEEIVQEIERSELRGRGGAGFPTGKKWRAARNARFHESRDALALPPHGNQKSDDGNSRGFESMSAGKYIVANADEGDPGAYIDRFLVEDDPHTLIEGMLIAGYAVGAEKGWIYLRKEYPAAKKVLEGALAEARAAGLLGRRVLNSDFAFDIELFIGQGSYVCGEETALLNSLEGRRPEVRSRPPFPTECGLFSRPTVVNNVETLVSVPWIVLNGGDAYRALGFSKSRGTKVVSLNSLFNRPGLYEVEFGVTVRHIVEELGGGLRTGRSRGVMIGGPFAGIIPPDLLDTPFGFEELNAIGASVGHGGVIAFDEHTSITELMHHVFAFAADESCGKCTACRLGTRRVERLFAKVLANGGANYSDESECERIVTALKLTSLCGLGTGLAEFAESALRHYGKELELCWR